jgi:peroxiredoxin
MKHIQTDTWTRSRSSQSQKKRKPLCDCSITAAFWRTIKPRRQDNSRGNLTPVVQGATMAIQSGDPIPEATFTVMMADGPQLRTTDQIFKGRKVVLFGVGGAFTPVCDKHHLPGFLDNLDQFKAQGVDEIAVTGVNDVFVMEAWAKSAGANGKITFLADGNGDFARAWAFARSHRGRARHSLAALCDDSRRGVPPMPGTTQWEDPVRHLTRKYELDYLPSKNYVWKQQTDRNRSFSSESLAEEILKWHLDNGGDPAW